jgi:NAD+ kinase
MTLSFQRIGIISRTQTAEIKESLETLFNFLLKQGSEVLLNQEANQLLDNNLTTTSIEDMGKTCDLAIVIGGDGCLLGAGRILSLYHVPLLGVNRGQLGFLTDIIPHQIEEELLAILSGQYWVEKRQLIQAYIYDPQKNTPLSCHNALNDIVIRPGKAVHMIEFDLFIDQTYVYTQKSDGLIICTPTGSTAYALSAGGPILHPSLNAFGLIPMFPHTLSSRPLVISSESQIKIKIGELKESNQDIFPQISCDGQDSESLKPGFEVLIHKQTEPLSLIHPLHHDFYDSCRSKLGWQHKLGR